MASLNRVLLIGRLTKDPETKKLPSGTAVADLRLAVDESYTSKEGQKVEKTLFVDVNAWSKLAEQCAEYLHKGSPVMVEGKLELSEWETDKGEKRSRLRVRAMSVEFLESGSRERGPSAKDIPEPVSPVKKQERRDEFPPVDDDGGVPPF